MSNLPSPPPGWMRNLYRELLSLQRQREVLRQAEDWRSLIWILAMFATGFVGPGLQGRLMTYEFNPVLLGCGFLLFLIHLNFKKLYLEREAARAALARRDDRLQGRKPRFRIVPMQDTNERKYFRFTPTDLKEMFANKSDKEVVELAGPYKDWWWAFEATVGTVKRIQGFAVIRIEKSDPVEPTITVHFRDSYRQAAWNCVEGEGIKIQGKMDHLNATSVWMTDCEPLK